MKNIQKQIIIWDEPENWVPLIQDLTGIKNDELINNEEIGSINPYEDAHPLLDEIIAISETLSMKAYHACRAINIDSYYKQGFKVPSFNNYSKLLKLYSEKIGYTTSTEDYEKLRESVQESISSDKIYFNCSRKELLDKSSHYLIYGSELIFSFFVDKLGYLAQDLLEDLIGIQTLFELEIPLSILNVEQNKSFCYSILLNCRYFVKYGYINQDNSFWVKNDLPGKYIINHTHPSNVQHSHKYGLKFTFKKNHPRQN